MPWSRINGQIGIRVKWGRESGTPPTHSSGRSSRNAQNPRLFREVQGPRRALTLVCDAHNHVVTALRAVPPGIAAGFGGGARNRQSGAMTITRLQRVIGSCTSRPLPWRFSREGRDEWRKAPRSRSFVPPVTKVVSGSTPNPLFKSYPLYGRLRVTTCHPGPLPPCIAFDSETTGGTGGCTFPINS